jgi:hypothetical protein
LKGKSMQADIYTNPHTIATIDETDLAAAMNLLVAVLPGAYATDMANALAGLATRHDAEAAVQRSLAPPLPPPLPPRRIQCRPAHSSNGEGDDHDAR